MMLNDLERLLLTKMSARQLVDAALAAEGLSREQLRDDVKAIEEMHGPFSQMHLARTYELLAQPWRIEPLNRELFPNVTISFDYKRRRFRLPLWSRVQFSVYEHPNGTVWSPRFEPLDDSLPRALDLRYVEPWCCTQVELEALSTRVQTVDGWASSIQMEMEFGDGAVYDARFDFGLLQTWERLRQPDPG